MIKTWQTSFQLCNKKKHLHQTEWVQRKPEVRFKKMFTMCWDVTSWTRWWCWGPGGRQPGGYSKWEPSGGSSPQNETTNQWQERAQWSAGREERGYPDCGSWCGNLRWCDADGQVEEGSLFPALYPSLSLKKKKNRKVIDGKIIMGMTLKVSNSKCS